MGWKECNVVDQRSEFVLRSLSEEVVFAELCREFGISPKTGYKWRERFMQQGLAGIHDQSRRPHTSPQQLNEEQICRIVKLKQAHPHWGPYKLQELYLRKHGQAPSESSFKRVLDKAGLVEHRRVRKTSSTERITTDLEVSKPNDVWTVDFKGWWKTFGGAKCEPLTVRDLYSRYILDIVAMQSSTTEQVEAAFEKIFERHGLPSVILSDNGPPFAAPHAPLGLSALSAWWISLGIRLHRIQPGHPEQNGSHERMHLDIRRELQGMIEGDLEDHQAEFDHWRKEYNCLRPHEALGMRVPAELYANSERAWLGRVQKLQYGSDYIERKVTEVGTICIDKTRVHVSSALRGWHVGLKYLSDTRLEVWFDYLRLGEIDLEVQRFFAAQKGC